MEMFPAAGAPLLALLIVKYALITGLPALIFISAQMPLQNRVTPFGDIVAIPERGLMLGNRGIIHDPASRRLLDRRWAGKAWIICLCEFRGRWRKVMGGRSWTELFFLDEATALAAGHRPCFYCRRQAAEAFRAAWTRGKGGAAPRASAMDAVLHAERLDGRRKRRHPLTTAANSLPQGAMIAAEDRAYLIAGGRALIWSPAGYSKVSALPGTPSLLTPPSTLRALAAGYSPILHPTALDHHGGTR